MFNVPSAKDSSENGAAWQITDAATAGMDPEGAGTVSEDASAVVHFELKLQVFLTPFLLVSALLQGGRECLQRAVCCLQTYCLRNAVLLSDCCDDPRVTCWCAPIVHTQL